MHRDTVVLRSGFEAVAQREALVVLMPKLWVSTFETTAGFFDRCRVGEKVFTAQRQQLWGDGARLLPP